MARTTANQKTPGSAALTGQQALDKLMSLEDIHGNRIDGPRALVILGIARQYGIKAEPIRGGLVRVRPDGRGYTIEIDV